MLYCTDLLSQPGSHSVQRWNGTLQFLIRQMLSIALAPYLLSDRRQHSGPSRVMFSASRPFHHRSTIKEQEFLCTPSASLYFSIP